MILTAFALKIKKIKNDISEALIIDDVIKKIEEETLKDYVKTEEWNKEISNYKALASKCKELEKSINKVEGLENSIKNINKKMEELEKSTPIINSNPLPQPNNKPIAAPESAKPSMPKSPTFWVGSPQNGVFKDSIYEYYKCEIIPNEKDKVLFTFNEDPDQRIQFFEKQTERINNLADIVSGFANVNSSLTNKEPGILKRNPHGEGWVLDTKAKIEFS